MDASADSSGAGALIISDTPTGDLDRAFALDALDFLRRVEESGHRPFDLAVEGSSSLDALLEPPYWTLPPSRRPASGGTVAAESGTGARCIPGAEVSDDPEDADRRVQVIELDARHHLLLVSRLDDWEDRAALCLVTVEDVVTCAASQLDYLRGVISAPRSSQWLVVAESSYGNIRTASRLLALVSATSGGLVTNTLSVGGVDGYGEYCDTHDSYCVWFEGHSSQLIVRAPGCVAVRPGPSWTATHVRVEDLWLDEMIGEPRGPETTYRVDGTTLVADPCAP